MLTCFFLPRLLRVFPGGGSIWQLSLYASRSSSTTTEWNQRSNTGSILKLYAFAAPCRSLILASTSNSFRLLSKLMRPSDITSGIAVSIIVRSVRKVPRYGIVP